MSIHSLTLALDGGEWSASRPGRLGAENFCFHHRARTALGPTQPPIQWVPGALSLAVKLNLSLCLTKYHAIKTFPVHN
jgi:hypothetical protein